MPLFEHGCDRCGYQVEQFYHSYRDVPQTVRCSECGGRMERLVSRVSMRPDSLWAGHIVEGVGYTTSTARVAKFNRARGIVEIRGRSDFEAVHKTAERARRDKEADLAHKSRRRLEKSLIGTGVLEQTQKMVDERAE